MEHKDVPLLVLLLSIQEKCDMKEYKKTSKIWANMQVGNINLVA